MMHRKQILALLIFLFHAVSAQAADQAVSNKQQYHLFHPTPVELMREMSTDRPDKTESPYTVDAGHVQVEMSLIDHAYDHHNPDEPQTRVDTFSYAPANFKIGLLNNADLQVIINPYAHEKTREDGVHSTKEGFGDMQTRLKVNIWGNDGGQTALALMPFIKFPTDRGHFGNDDMEGGIIVPLAVGLAAEWNMGLMAEVDLNKNKSDDNYHREYIHSITFGHAIVGGLSGYVEFFSHISTEEDAKLVATVDAGLTYALTEYIQLDMGINIGATAAADDLNPFCGFSMRY
ncbi:MAG: transporter [Candidatus Omnitrophota bacterium]|nr:transporter [Candidatus Omnitrophota bacterium]